MVDQFDDSGHSATALDAQPLGVSRRKFSAHDDIPHVGVRLDAFATRYVPLVQEIGDPMLQLDVFHGAGRAEL